MLIDHNQNKGGIRIRDPLEYDKCEVKFVEITNDGFYRYEIKRGDKHLTVSIEPYTIEALEFCIKDAMARHEKDPKPSFLDGKQPSCISSINAAIANIIKKDINN